MKRYRSEVPGPDGWSRWLQPKRRGYRLCCCDCGLVHELQFRLVPSANGWNAILYRARRDARATGQVRRYSKGR